MGDDAEQHWIPKLFKGRPVHVRCNPDGAIRIESGLADIRYSTGPTRLYRGSVGNLAEMAVAKEPVILPDPALPFETPAPSPAAGAPAPKPTRAPPPARAGAIVAWTDGACSGNPGPAGLGAVLIEAHQRTEISGWIGEATNNIAELRAIEEALNHIPDAAMPVDLYTDSSYSIGVLTKGWKAKANKELIERIRGVVRQFTNLQMHWVKGHVGTEENECADELARRAVETRNSTLDRTPTKETL